MKGLFEEEKEDLLIDLNLASKKMQNKYALLVDKTRRSLEAQNVPITELVALIEQSYFSKLSSEIEEANDIK